MPDVTTTGRRGFLRFTGAATGIVAVSSTATATSHDGGTTSNLSLSLLGRYESGIFDDGGAEIPTYDPTTERVFVINANAGIADVLDVSDPTGPSKVGDIDPSGDLPSGFTVGGVNSVDVYDRTVALAIEGGDVQADGRVAFYEANGNNAFLGSTQVGPLPDLVTFSPDGNSVLVSNEGEPTDDYSVDPEGSVSVIDVSGGFPGTEVTAGFGDFSASALRNQGVRIFGPDTSAARDLEPEYVAVAPDNQTAYVTLQENNAIGKIDISDPANPSVTDIFPLGYKDHSIPGNELDAIDNGTISIENEPLFGMYQPDAIEAYEAGGETYLVIANEGDAREYDALFETGVLTDTGGGDFVIEIDDDGESATENVDVDESAFSPGVLSELEDLEVTARPPTFGEGDVSDPGPVEELYLFGGRSYSILDSDGNIVFESGSQFEEIVRDSDDVPDQQFNADDDENNDADDDSESEASGPEPEGVAVGQVGDRTMAFVGFEEVGGVAAFDVSSPTSPTFVDYINTRDFSVGPEDEIEDGDQPASAAGDLAPEGLAFVSAADSPIEDGLLVVGYEVSGTTSLYSVSEADETTETSTPAETVSPGQPGLGALAALGGLGVSSWLLHRWDDDGA
jgi:DNA-binding beta-propeller fold protein YncE